MAPATTKNEAARELPILFSAEMVRAILDNRKGETRRVVMFPLNYPHTGGNPPDKLFGDWGLSEVGALSDGVLSWECQSDVDDSVAGTTRCPYGTPGDLLYAKETFRLGGEWDEYPPGGVEPQYHGIKTPVVWYEEEGHCAIGPDDWGKRRPSIFMPKWASRLWLRVTDVQVERVRDISLDNCIAEGVGLGRSATFDPQGPGPEPDELFAALWDSINAKRGFGWDTNPWVWAVSFERTEAPA